MVFPGRRAESRAYGVPGERPTWAYVLSSQLGVLIPVREHTVPLTERRSAALSQLAQPEHPSSEQRVWPGAQSPLLSPQPPRPRPRLSVLSSFAVDGDFLFQDVFFLKGGAVYFFHPGMGGQTFLSHSVNLFHFKRSRWNV